MLMICRYILLDAEHASLEITVAQRICNVVQRVRVYQIPGLIKGRNKILQEIIDVIDGQCKKLPEVVQ